MYVLMIACLAAIGYTYLIYPLALWLVSRSIRPGPATEPGCESLPALTLVVSAYNEEACIRDKLANSLELEYPRDRYRIIVASDCSNDGTDGIVASFADPRISLLRQERRAGKNAGQNAAAASVGEGILAFTDASTRIEGGALLRLAERFADPSVGCVCGRLAYRGREQGGGYIEELDYWSYEGRIREWEGSRLRSPIVFANGGLTAVRASAFVPLSADIPSDFVEPFLIRAAGYKILYDPRALAYEAAAADVMEEFRRKRRIVLQGISAIARYPAALVPIAHPSVLVHVLSRKLLRWLSPFWLLGALIGALCLPNTTIAAAVAYAAGAFAALGLAGILSDPSGRRLGRLFSGPAYVCAVMGAAALGWLDFCLGRRAATWEHPPRPGAFPACDGEEDEGSGRGVGRKP